jgi:hypothetical protein
MRWGDRLCRHAFCEKYWNLVFFSETSKKNTSVGLGDHFAGFIDEQVARGDSFPSLLGKEARSAG